MRIRHLYPKGYCIPSVCKSLHLQVQTRQNSHASGHIHMQTCSVHSLVGFYTSDIFAFLKCQPMWSFISSLQVSCTGSKCQHLDQTESLVFHTWRFHERKKKMKAISNWGKHWTENTCVLRKNTPGTNGFSMMHGLERTLY